MKRTIIVISLILSTSLAAIAQRDIVGAGYPYYYPTYIDLDTLPHESPLGLAAGVYMVRVGTPLGTATRRLLVQ